MDTIQGKYFIRGNDLREDYEFDNSFLSKGNNFYEVVRIQSGVVLFLDEHLNRFEHSARFSNLRPFINFQEIRKLLFRLIRANKLESGNIKLVFHFGSGEWEKTFLAYPIPFYYPEPEVYKNGVIAETYKFERPNPTVKNWFPEYKAHISNLKKEKGIYDFILEKEDGSITEGSQTNLFVIKDDTIVTAPKETVLEGITRLKIFEICDKYHLPIIEKVFNIEFLYKSESVFFSGTSAKILPVRKINDTFINPGHPLIKQLSLYYDDLVDQYIIHHKNEF
jgi:branched-chain amino acid aminotransferase